MTSGSVMAEVIRVGADNYAVRLTSEAKTHKAIRSELVDSIRKVSKFTSFVIIPLGIILFLEALFIRDASIKISVIASAAALLGMLPKGLVLLISIALTTGVTKLAKNESLFKTCIQLKRWPMSIHYAWIKQGPLLKENEYPAGRSTTSAVRESHPRNYGDVSGRKQ